MGEGARIAWGRLILGGVFALAIFTVLAVLIGPLLAMTVAGGSHYQIANNGMAPALVVGDWVLVEKIHPGDVPERGDIVVYDDPTMRRRQNVMRVIGLPGDRVQMRAGALYLNGRRAEMVKLGERVVAKRPPGRRTPVPLCINDPVAIGDECRQEIWRESLADGNSHRVLNSRRQLGLARLSAGKHADDTTLFRVPKGHVFVMGDNRDQAVDSRSRGHGTVPLENLRYEVWMIHTSLDRSARFPIPRWQRFFRPVE